VPTAAPRADARARTGYAGSDRRARAGAHRATADGRIRWDRVGRVALLCLLFVVLMLYIAPLRNWLAQSRMANLERGETHALEREHERLARRARDLERPAVIEREARRLGMVRRGERPFVIEGGPAAR